MVKIAKRAITKLLDANKTILNDEQFDTVFELHQNGLAIVVSLCATTATRTSKVTTKVTILFIWLNFISLRKYAEKLKRNQLVLVLISARIISSAPGKLAN